MTLHFRMRIGFNFSVYATLIGQAARLRRSVRLNVVVQVELLYIKCGLQGFPATL